MDRTSAADMYTIEYYKPADFEKYKEEWQELEVGKDMTYFQTYDWNKLLLPYLKKDNLLHENVYALVRNQNHQPVLIAPLWILKYSIYPYFEQRGIYFIGRSGWPDYLNLIYTVFDADAFEFLLSDLKRKYGIGLFCPQLLKEETDLYKYLKTDHRIKVDFNSTCVELALQDDFDIYHKSLSKGVRQNIRTAYNRLEKDGKRIQFVFDDKDADLNKCWSLRSARLGKKNYVPNFVQRLKIRILDLLSFKFPGYKPLFIDKNSHVMTAYIDNELVAFFQYVNEPLNKRIILMAVGTSIEYSKYSPGMLLMFKYIENQTHEKDIAIVDFSRGNEYYKYQLGGRDHMLHHIMMKI